MIKTPNDCVSDECQYSGHDDGVLVDAHESEYAVRLVIHLQDVRVDDVDRAYARDRARDIHADVHEF